MIIKFKEAEKQESSHITGKFKEVIIGNNIIPHLLQFAKAKFDKGEVIEIHNHLTMNEVFYILKGKIFLNLDNREFTLNAGDTFIVFKHKNHYLKFLEDTELLYFNLEDYN